MFRIGGTSLPPTGAAQIQFRISGAEHCTGPKRRRLPKEGLLSLSLSRFQRSTIRYHTDNCISSSDKGLDDVEVYPEDNKLVRL